MIKELAHIGICVYSIDKTMDLLKNCFGAVETKRFSIPERNQVSAYVEIGEKGTVLELMEPIGDQGVVASFLQKRGEGIHHISFHSDDAENEFSLLEDSGCRIIDRAQGLGFTHPKTTFGVLIEVFDDTCQ